MVIRKGLWFWFTFTWMSDDVYNYFTFSFRALPWISTPGKVIHPKYYRVSHIEMCNCKWFWGVEGSMILLMSRSNGHLTFGPYISYKCQRLASTVSESEGAKYHRKTGFLMINPTKRGFQGGWGQENHSVSKALAFLAFLRSKRLSRSSRLLRSSWMMEPMRPLSSSDSLRNLNSII